MLVQIIAVSTPLVEPEKEVSSVPVIPVILEPSAMVSLTSFLV